MASARDDGRATSVGAAGAPLRVLLLEDDPDDADLVLRELRRGGYDIVHECVQSACAMNEALDRESWDLILSDYSMPGFDAVRAIAIVRERGLEVPFIIVSGTVDEETAVEVMRAGAQDFMAKGKLARLLPAVARELLDARARVEHREMREQLLVSDRMASLGTLAAGVAHEINNPLAAVLGNTEVLLFDNAKVLADARTRSRGTDDDETWVAWLDERLGRAVPMLEDVREAALRVRDVAGDLKVFSRTGETRRGPVDVHAVIESSLRLGRNEIRHRARVVREYGDVPHVDANETRLGQVFLNLVVNAAQALPEGQADRQRIRIVTRLERSDRVRIEVHDTGPGIPNAVLARIFDPFFTTKPIGEGTGLGLAICHRIVTSFGGELSAESRPGVGTVFRVSLPVATSSLAEGKPNVAVVPPASAHRAQVLVIDDDAMVAGALRRFLEPQHEVTIFTSARTALDAIARGASYDLIFCDLLMPELSGMDLFDALAVRAPEQAGRMVFMTGGAFTSAAREFMARVRQPRIEKPFDIPAIRALIDALLG